MIPGDERLFERPGDGFAAADDLRERDTRSLLSELVEEGRRLVREEIHLARSEVKKDVADTARGVGLFGAAGVLGHAALLAFVAAAILLLSLVMPAWVAALAVGVVLVVVSLVLVAAARAAIGRVHVLDETMESIREDKRWASETMRSARAARRS